jgi:hypothetical protein
MTWDYVIAERLHKTVAEVHTMANTEWEAWCAYFHVQGVLADLEARTAANRSKAHGHR